MQKKIETMIGGIGELSLSAIATWFPSKSKEEIVIEIKNSDKLIIEDDIVMDKARKGYKEKVGLESRNLNLATQVEVINPKEVVVKTEKNKEVVNINRESNTDISYEELIELIDYYNKTVKGNYKKTINKSFENISAAILKYYKKRFNIIKHDFVSEDGGIIYSLRHRKSGLEVAYLYIGEYLTRAALDKISETFEYDTVYFCITKDAEVVPNLSKREFYLKDVEEITEEYLGQYKLVECKVGILKIDEGSKIYK